MTDWKEGVMREYHALERARQMTEEEMAKNPSLCKLIEEKRYIEEQIVEQEREYRGDIHECNLRMQKIRDDLIERWDIEGKSYKCNEGNATLRTTRSLKVDNKETLIGILQQIGKLTQSIKGWDLTYLRKLADAGLFDVAKEEMNIMHYDEKKNVVITAAKKESDRDEE